MTKLSVAEARAYASKIVDRLTDEGVFGDSEALRQNHVRIVAEELQEIFGDEKEES